MSRLLSSGRHTERERDRAITSTNSKEVSVAEKYKQGEQRKTKSECTKVRHESNTGVLGGIQRIKAIPLRGYQQSTKEESRRRERLTNYVQIIRNFAFVENLVQREEEHTEVSHASNRLSLCHRCREKSVKSRTPLNRERTHFSQRVRLRIHLHKVHQC